jgi:hypothetical protein
MPALPSDDETVWYVNDASTLKDGFGITLAGDQVARVALEVATPFTLGVVGKWGSGKTSVLRRAFATLKGKPMQIDVPLGAEARKDMGPDGWDQWFYDSSGRAAQLGWKPKLTAVAAKSLCVWYSPWQHQGEDNPLIPLLLEIRAQYTTWIKLREKASNLNRRGGLAGLVLLERAVDAAASLVLGRSARLAEGTTDAVRKAWREAAPEEPGLSDGQRFHLLFEDAVETLLDGIEGGEKTSGRLILFIDDLDRCEESTVVQLLETIKLYLGSRRCVFILALDESAVLSALTSHWPARSDDANREYLEKLFQAIVPVPVPRPGAVCSFLTAQLKAHDFPDPEGAAEMIDDLLEPNPRKVKNFVNGICANWELFRQSCPAKEEGDRQLFAHRFLLFHYLRVQHKPVWRLLERQPWALRVLTKVLLGLASTDVKLPKNVGADDQRMLELLLFRAFSHVLKDDGGKDDHHRHIPIAEAVELLNQRIDRKRSDEHFIRFYRELIPRDMDLPEAFLYLPQAPEPAPHA